MSLELRAKNLQHSNGLGLGLGGPSGQWAEFFSLVKSIAIFFGIAFMLRASVVEAFKIPSSSMEPTLQIGDHILVNKLSYGIRLPFKAENLFSFREPKRKDVVVFTRPDDPATPGIDESDTNIIKRVIGVGGDEVMIRGTKLYINGKVFEEDDKYAVWVRGGLRDFGPETVPPNKVLVLGDNRDQSKDGRYWDHDHFLENSRIKGRAFLIYWNLASLKRMFSVIE